MLLPLYMQTDTNVEHSEDNRYFQLGILSGKNRYDINGEEEEEGLIDFNQQQIVLQGTDHDLQNGNLIGFYWHETLPNSIKSHHAYRIDSLSENNEYNRTTFKLIDNETSEDLLFSDTELQLKINQYQAGDKDSGLRMWRAKLNHHIRVDHEAVIFKMGDDHFSEIEKDPPATLRSYLKRPILTMCSTMVDLVGQSGSLMMLAMSKPTTFSPC